MIILNFKPLIVMVTFCVLSNAHTLVTDNVTKTKDIDILRQLLNQESLFRIALTKDVESLKHLLTKQTEDMGQHRFSSESRHLMEERNFINSSLLKTLFEEVSNLKIEEMSKELSLQREHFSMLSDNFTKLSVMILEGFERLENMSIKLMQKTEALPSDIEEKVNSCDKRYRDCHEILKQNNCNYLMKQSGVYTIYVGQSYTSRRVFCDMTTDGGGWTVIQRRFDGSTDFYRGWEDYKEGFGDPSKEYWLGNDAIHYLTDGRYQELRIEMEKFSGTVVFARYSNFLVGNETEKYKLSIGGYSGNAGDYITKSHDLNGSYFSTKDRDNDKCSQHCATNEMNGAWWFNCCGYSDLNGLYRLLQRNKSQSLHWGTSRENMKTTKMMIKPRL